VNGSRLTFVESSSPEITVSSVEQLTLVLEVSAGITAGLQDRIGHREAQEHRPRQQAVVVGSAHFEEDST